MESLNAGHEPRGPDARYVAGRAMLQDIFGEIRLVEAGEELYAEFESPLQRLLLADGEKASSSGCGTGFEPVTFALRARAKARQQLAVYASESAVAHDHHAVTGPRRLRDCVDQSGEIIVELRAGFERRQRFGSVPPQVRGVAKYAIGRRKTGGQH